MAIICCKYEARCDSLTELKKGTIREASYTLSTAKNVRNFTVVSNTEQIILKQKENPLKDYSLVLFQKINEFRLEPHKFYRESIQYNFTNIVKDLINNKNAGIDLQLKWSSKNELIIYDIM